MPTEDHLAELIRYVVCPGCHQPLARHGEADTAVSLRCTGCCNHYPVVDGIPVLLIPRATKG